MSDTGALVYVVDDDAGVRDGVADLIRSAGLMAETFASGEEFLTAARPERPSCLMLDVSLPGVSGLDVQQALTKSDIQVPIRFLTGHGDIPLTVQAVRAGAVNVLTKPFDDQALMSAVRQCIASCDEERLDVESTRKRMVSGSGAPIRILAVDDHPLVREGIAGLVGIQPDMTLVAQAANGRDAIQQFRTHRPDIVLMDIQLPEMNGLVALIAIRTEFPDARVIPA